jgi:hypothetical protein
MPKGSVQLSPQPGATEWVFRKSTSSRKKCGRSDIIFRPEFLLRSTTHLVAFHQRCVAKDGRRVLKKPGGKTEVPAIATGSRTHWSAPLFCCRQYRNVEKVLIDLYNSAGTQPRMK